MFPNYRQPANYNHLPTPTSTPLTTTASSSEENYCHKNHRFKIKGATVEEYKNMSNSSSTCSFSNPHSFSPIDATYCKQRQYLLLQSSDNNDWMDESTSSRLQLHMRHQCGACYQPLLQGPNQIASVCTVCDLLAHPECQRRLVSRSLFLHFYIHCCTTPTTIHCSVRDQLSTNITSSSYHTHYRCSNCFTI